ncbi:MAG: hypothetical protein EBX63_02610, partial [Betaproteobacteria bacterium]|nr:hypothetical protein [Betaproteobacteria bacterium]
MFKPAFFGPEPCRDLVRALRASLFVWLRLGSFMLALLPWVSQATSNPADPKKVLKIAFPTAESGFDPVRVNDL